MLMKKSTASRKCRSATADGRSDRWRERGRHREDGVAHRPHARRQIRMLTVIANGMSARPSALAARGNDHHVQILREGAEHREDDERDHAEEQVPLDRKGARKKAVVQ